MRTTLWSLLLFVQAVSMDGCGEGGTKFGCGAADSASGFLSGARTAASSGRLLAAKSHFMEANE